MNTKNFDLLLQELIDENPFAIRAVLKILTVEFTDSVPTLAVTCEAKPKLLVNLDFVSEHCRTESHVKAVLCHEFLHVLLRHTEQKKQLTHARHLAFDAVINAIIHREHGAPYSSMMAKYYGKSVGIQKLLRPMNAEENDWYHQHYFKQGHLPQWALAWHALYEGKLVADDIESLAQQLSKVGQPGNGSNSEGSAPGPFQLEDTEGVEIEDLLGNHKELGQELPEELEDAINHAMKEMNGSGIWRNPGEHGVGANPYQALFTEKDEPMKRWQKKALDVLKRHLQPDRKSRALTEEPSSYRIPVLSPSDRRAFIKSIWSPFMPDATWSSSKLKRDGTAQVYLDVSGSMNAEMPQIIALLGRLSKHIKRPFWAFSNVVEPATIEKGQLKTNTTGGTSMACVLEHIAKTKPVSAVVVTDGYIERVPKELLTKTRLTRLHVILTRDGSPSELHRAKIPYTQLDKMPS